MWRQVYDDDWERARQQRLRNMFVEPVLSPIREESRAEVSHRSDAEGPAAPLPELVVERVPRRARQDEPEDYYNQLEEKIKKYLRKLATEPTRRSYADIHDSYDLSQLLEVHSETNDTMNEAFVGNCSEATFASECDVSATPATHSSQQDMGEKSSFTKSYNFGSNEVDEDQLKSPLEKMVHSHKDFEESEQSSFDADIDNVKVREPQDDHMGHNRGTEAQGEQSDENNNQANEEDDDASSITSPTVSSIILPTRPARTDRVKNKEVAGQAEAEEKSTYAEPMERNEKEVGILARHPGTEGDLEYGNKEGSITESKEPTMSQDSEEECAVNFKENLECQRRTCKAGEFNVLITEGIRNGGIVKGSRTESEVPPVSQDSEVEEHDEELEEELECTGSMEGDNGLMKGSRKESEVPPMSEDGDEEERTEELEEEIECAEGMQDVIMQGSRKESEEPLMSHDGEEDEYAEESEEDVECNVEEGNGKEIHESSQGVTGEADNETEMQQGEGMEMESVDVNNQLDEHRDTRDEERKHKDETYMCIYNSGNNESLQPAEPEAIRADNASPTRCSLQLEASEVAVSPHHVSEELASAPAQMEVADESQEHFHPLLRSSTPHREEAAQDSPLSGEMSGRLSIRSDVTPPGCRVRSDATPLLERAPSDPTVLVEGSERHDIRSEPRKRSSGDAISVDASRAKRRHVGVQTERGGRWVVEERPVARASAGVQTERGGRWVVEERPAARARAGVQTERGGRWVVEERPVARASAGVQTERGGRWVVEERPAARASAGVQTDTDARGEEMLLRVSSSGRPLEVVWRAGAGAGGGDRRLYFFL